jgi:hypothetical protein
MKHKILRLTCSGGLAALLSLTAQAGEADPPEVQMRLDREATAASTLTRAEVMAELMQAQRRCCWRPARSLDPQPVLDARERFNVQPGISRTLCAHRADERRTSPTTPCRPRHCWPRRRRLPQQAVAERADGTPITDRAPTPVWPCRSSLPALPALQPQATPATAPPPRPDEASAASESNVITNERRD